MELKEIKDRIVYLKPSPKELEKFELYRTEAFCLALKIDEICIDSREKSLALTKLEEVLFWVDKAVVKFGYPPPSERSTEK